MPPLDQAQAMQELTPVFRQVFDDSTLILRENMTAADVAGWDSLSHIDLIVAIERRFKIRFTTREVTALKTIGDLAQLTASKVSATA